MDTNDEANYAQDDPAYSDYITQAAGLVEGLMHGDTEPLESLTENFAGSLKARMQQRVKELADERINQDEFDLEVRKMVSVACIGLREKAEGQ